MPSTSCLGSSEPSGRPRPLARSSRRGSSTRRRFTPTASSAHRSRARSPLRRCGGSSSRCGTQELNRVQSVQEWLDLCGMRVYSALQQSNWNAETFECYLDLGAFGTAAVFMVERDDPAASKETGLSRDALQGDPHRHLRHRGGCRGARRYPRLRLLAPGHRRRAAVRGTGVRRAAHLTRRRPSRRIRSRSSTGSRPARTASTARRSRISRGPPATSQSATSGSWKSLATTWPRSPSPRWTKSSGETYGRGPGAHRPAGHPHPQPHDRTRASRHRESHRAAAARSPSWRDRGGANDPRGDHDSAG